MKLLNFFNHAFFDTCIKSFFDSTEIGTLLPGTISEPAGLKIKIGTSLLGNIIVSGNFKWDLVNDHQVFIQILKDFVGLFPFASKPLPKKSNFIKHILKKTMRRFCK